MNKPWSPIGMPWINSFKTTGIKCPICSVTLVWDQWCPCNPSLLSSGDKSCQGNWKKGSWVFHKNFTCFPFINFAFSRSCQGRESNMHIFQRLMNDCSDAGKGKFLQIDFQSTFFFDSKLWKSVNKGIPSTNSFSILVSRQSCFRFRPRSRCNEIYCDLWLTFILALVKNLASINSRLSQVKEH